MYRYIRYIWLLLVFLPSGNARCQKIAVGSNLLGYANLGTMNVEVSYALGRRWSIAAGAKYNPFSFSSRGNEFRNRQQSYAVGARFWPWHVYSGWWVAGKLQYQEYSTAGIISPGAEEGDRFGAGLTAGYTYMLHPRLNLEFGLGFWAGFSRYSSYDSAVCGVSVGHGGRGFFLPNDVIIGITYVF